LAIILRKVTDGRLCHRKKNNFLEVTRLWTINNNSTCQENTCFYVTPRVCPVFTETRYWIPSWPKRTNLSLLYYFFLTHSTITSIIRLCLPRGLFYIAFQETKTNCDKHTSFSWISRKSYWDFRFLKPETHINHYRNSGLLIARNTNGNGNVPFQKILL
jgi:hypothetical protein